MACVITSPSDAIRCPTQNFTYKHIDRLRGDAIYSFGCFIFSFMKAPIAVNYLYAHTDKGGVEALLFAIKWLTTAVWVSCCKMRRKVLHDGNSLIKVFKSLYCTSIMWLKLEYSTCLNSFCVYFDCDFSRIKVIKKLCLHARSLIRVLS